MKISRKDAINQGLKFYFTGKPCKREHIANRRVPHGTCIECEREHQISEVQRKYHRELKRTKKYKNMAREYRQRIYGTEQYKMAARKTHLKRTYGITLDEFDSLVNLQNNKCKICKSSFNEIQPCIDHCHKTGIVRGILCKSCNQMLGFSKDNAEVLEEAIKYLT